MITEEIRVSWIEERNITLPIDNVNPQTKEDLDACEKAKELSKIRKQGVIIDFTTSLFGNTKAIINSGDNKIVKVPIEKLTVLHKAKKK